jgi:hypothetical protein
MNTCYQCNERLHSEIEQLPANNGQGFVQRYFCRNGHTGTLEGQAGTEEQQWGKYGEVWAPSERADAPDTVKL